MGRPGPGQGFSDPDLTQDKGGRIYNTGINLVADSFFSTIDGGVTWDKGTADCHDGDRPWLAGVDKATAWLATNTEGGAHRIFTTDTTAATPATARRRAVASPTRAATASCTGTPSSTSSSSPHQRQRGDVEAR